MGRRSKRNNSSVDASKKEKVEQKISPRKVLSEKSENQELQSADSATIKEETYKKGHDDKYNEAEQNGDAESPSSSHSTKDEVKKEAEPSDNVVMTEDKETDSSAPSLNRIVTEVLTKTIQDEEEKLEKLHDKQEADETEKFMQEIDKEEEKIKEERYEKLQLLLTKSEMYTRYLLGRMEDQKTAMAELKQDQLKQTGEGPPAKKKAKKMEPTSVQSSQSSQTSEADLALQQGAPILFNGTLRPYQIDGLLWLNTMFENGVNGILADEMGLGKTIQCIAAIAHLVTMNVTGPYLVVAPLSTLPNWVNEFNKFAPKVPVMLYHGPKLEREKLRQKIPKLTEIDGQWWSQPVVCTSYEVAMQDRQFLMSMHWKYLIVDEGHRIKNSQCRLIKELRLYDSTHRLLLTGTPLQNNLSELWSLLNFLLPEVFDDLDSFEYWFKLDCLKKDQQDQLIAEEKKRNVLAMLHKIMTPFILRRLKSDVELNLPPKQELMVFAPLTEQQRGFYEATVNKSIDQLLNKNEAKKTESLIIQSESGKRTRRSTTKEVNYMSQLDVNGEDDEASLDKWVEEVMKQTESRVAGPMSTKKLGTHVHNIKMQNNMMMLRKCCNHPYLLSQPIDPETGYAVINEEVVNSSGKMLLLDAMLKELKQRGHKVLIFSQMTKMMDLIEDYCHLREYQYCRLDGSTDINSRREQMEAFNTDPQYFLFLLSTRAGGLGINLCAADTVIIYDSDWNPQCDLQAQDRAHRIGQTNPVMVYRIVCGNTIDEKIVERAARKRRLEKMIIHKEKFKTGMTKSYADECKPITAQELLELLKSHDHNAIVAISDRKRVINKRELSALLDRSELHRQWQANMNKGASDDKIKTPPSSPKASRRKAKKSPAQGSTKSSSAASSVKSSPALSTKSSGMSRVFKVLSTEGLEADESEL